MEIELQTLTPIWTGDIDQNSDHLRETGLIGSLRWWCEALVRGLGGYACDPTDEKRCQYDPKEKASPEEQLCPVCYLFGCTGWARRFRLIIREIATKPEGPKGKKETSGQRYNTKSERPNWYFKGYGKGGNIICSVVPLFDMNTFENGLLISPFKLIENNAALGAKTQLGYGWVRITKSPLFEPNEFIQLLQEKVRDRPKNKELGLPSLSEMFFVQISPKNEAGIITTLDFRYDLRSALRKTFNDKELRHFICGSVGKERQASKIFCTQAVNGEMRIWGWIPNELPSKIISRERVLDGIYHAIKDFGVIKAWREWSSKRDTNPLSIKDKADFLESLIH